MTRDRGQVMSPSIGPALLVILAVTLYMLWQVSYLGGIIPVITFLLVLAALTGVLYRARGVRA